MKRGRGKEGYQGQREKKGEKKGMEQERHVEHKQKGLTEHIIGAPNRAETMNGQKQYWKR